MKRFWDFAEANPFVVIFIIMAIISAILKIVTGSEL